MHVLMNLAEAPARLSKALPRIAGCLEADPRLFARALGWRLVLPLLKNVVPVRVLASRMSRAARRGDPAHAAARIAAVRRLVSDGGRLVISGNCLERSLLLFRLLSEARRGTALVIGVRREGTRVAGHAWVELDGQIFAESQMPAHEPIVRYEAR
jgi:hypothetical protein